MVISGQQDCRLFLFPALHYSIFFKCSQSVYISYIIRKWKPTFILKQNKESKINNGQGNEKYDCQNQELGGWADNRTDTAKDELSRLKV